MILIEAESFARMATLNETTASTSLRIVIRRCVSVIGELAFRP